MKTLLFGRDDYSKKKWVNERRRQLFQNQDPSLNFQEFADPESEVGALISFASTSPFLSEKRLAVLWSVDQIKEKDQPIFLNWVKNTPKFLELVLTCRESGPKKDAFLQALTQACQTQVFHIPFEDDLPRWVTSQAQKKGLVFNHPLSMMLIEKTGKDLALLDSEIEKISVFKGSGGVVTAEELHLLIGKSMDEELYPLYHAVFTKRPVQAIKFLDQAMSQGTTLYEVIPGLAMQAERLFRAALRKEEGLSPAQVAEELKIAPFIQRSFFEELKLAESTRLKELLDGLHALDVEIKSGASLERFQLEKALVGYTG